MLAVSVGRQKQEEYSDYARYMELTRGYTDKGNGQGRIISHGEWQKR
jgi:hypothetical protein